MSFGLIDPARKKKKGRRPATKKDRRSIIEDPTTGRLYIGNLNYDLTDEELEAAFAPLGKVVSAAVVRHGDSGRSKGFGFVEMGSVEEARAAVSKLNDTDLKGRKLLVSGAKAEKPRVKEERPRREGGRNDRGERRSREGGDRPPRREGRSRDRREGGRRRSDDRIEKPARQVQPPKIEQVSGPKLLVSKLNKDATEVDIADLFDGIGEIREKSEITVKDDSPTGELTVEFTETAAAQRAVEVIDMKFFMGHQLRLKGIDGGGAPAQPEEEAPAEETPSEEAPSEEVAAEEAPVEGSSVEETPAEEAPSEESKDEEKS
ncbi:MAG: RNA-binding protein [Verrucomicrobiota bacterium]